MASQIGKKTSRINTWKPTKKSELIVEKDGKLFLCHFDKVFGYDENLTPYNVFIIGKESYLNKVPMLDN